MTRDSTFFLPYQRRWILDASRIKVMEKSRQIGMTWTAAYRAVRETAVDGQRLDCWVASRDELQARLFLEDCRKWAGVLDLAARELDVQVLEEGRPSAGSLELGNGRRVHCLSSNADAQAGKRGTRILDEFALHMDPERLYGVAYPGITWGGQLEIISTHRGSGNYFNRLVQEVHDGNPKGISLHRVTLQDALEQGFLARLKTKLPPEDPRQTMGVDDYLAFVRKGCPDEETWLQEYCCVPADDISSFLPLELVCNAEWSPEAQAGGQKPWALSLAEIKRLPGRLYLGVDVGRDHDLTVLWLLQVSDEQALTRRLHCLKGEPFNRQEQALDELLALPSLRRCCIDATGIGRQFAERAQQRYGIQRVEAVTLSAPMKEELAYPVRSALENRSLRIPPMPEVRADLRAIRRETSHSGTLRFTADRGRNGHADRFWALALALQAARFTEAHRQLYAEAIGTGSRRF